MAETGKTPIQHYRTSTAAAVPLAANLADGEIAINRADKKIFAKNNVGTVVELAGTTNLGVTGGTTAGPIITSDTGTNATIPTATGSASGIITTGAQTLAGVKTFSSNPVSTATQATGTTALTRKDYVDTKLAKASNLSDLNNAATSRTNLGLGTIATQAANNVAITGGSVTGITDLTIADGGTGASTAANARTNLGLSTGATSTVTTSATDTTAGRLLKVGDFGLGANCISVTNVDTIDRTGFYFCAGTATGTPVSIAGQIIHAKVDANFATQTYICYGGAIALNVTRRFIRHKDDGAWETWKEIYHTGNILGTVSQSAGVPTGAVIERGSNANGGFVKFADGTMICTYIGSSSNGGADQFDVSRTFAAPFISPASIIAGTESLTPSFRFKVSASNGAAASTLRFNRTVGASATETIGYCFTVIGRWF